MKKFIKDLAACIIFPKEIEENNRKIKNLNHELKILRDENHNLRKEINCLREENNDLRKMSFTKQYTLLSETIFKRIIDILPDCNEAGMGNISNIVTEDYQIKILKTNNGSQNQAMIHLPDYGVNVHIPLIKKDFVCFQFGVKTSIETYFWDFDNSGIQVVSDKVWEYSNLFLKASNNVLEELKQDDLL